MQGRKLTMSDKTEQPEENAENVRSSSRERVLTEKGLAYQTELLQRDGDSALTLSLPWATLVALPIDHHGRL